MILTLTDKGGCEIDSWYIPESETSEEELRNMVALALPVYDCQQEFEDLSKPKQLDPWKEKK